MTIPLADYEVLVDAVLNQNGATRCDICTAWLMDTEDAAAVGLPDNEDMCWAEVYGDQAHRHLCKRYRADVLAETENG